MRGCCSLVAFFGCEGVRRKYNMRIVRQSSMSRNQYCSTRKDTMFSKWYFKVSNKKVATTAMNVTIPRTVQPTVNTVICLSLSQRQRRGKKERKEVHLLCEVFLELEVELSERRWDCCRVGVHKLKSWLQHSRLPEDRRSNRLRAQQSKQLDSFRKLSKGFEVWSQWYQIESLQQLEEVLQSLTVCLVVQSMPYDKLSPWLMIHLVYKQRELLYQRRTTKR